jgi:hypothetical protein
MVTSMPANRQMAAIASASTEVLVELRGVDGAIVGGRAAWLDTFEFQAKAFWNKSVKADNAFERTVNHRGALCLGSGIVARRSTRSLTVHDNNDAIPLYRIYCLAVPFDRVKRCNRYRSECSAVDSSRAHTTRHPVRQRGVDH